MFLYFKFNLFFHFMHQIQHISFCKLRLLTLRHTPRGAEAIKTYTKNIEKNIGDLKY